MFRTQQGKTAMIRTVLLVAITLASPVLAHDTWVETNTNVVRMGDAVYVDLRLGNHGNDHRDFKLASKVDLAACTLNVIAPDGTSYDLMDRLADLGYAPKEGYWCGKFVAAEPGLYAISHTVDKLVNHGTPARSIKSGKTFFVVSPSLDRISTELTGFDRPLGHALELVPTANPITPMGPGVPIKVQLLFKGQPLADARVSFIPRGETLREGFDDRYERMTDADGRTSFIPTTGNEYLAVVHHRVDDEKGAGYDATTYSATLTVFVPEVCPCCEE
jgi:uncharacterized GH25 family protein